MSYPKIELHVHLEGSVSPEALIAAAARNGWELPVSSPEALAEFMRFRDFDHFMKAWFATTPALSAEQDYRELVVDYARRAAAQGAVYIEAIFSPTDKIAQGVSLDTCFEGFCDGIAQARDELGVEMRLTPDITRGLCDLDTAKRTAEYAVRYRDRGIVGLGLGGPETGNPPEPYAEAFAIARDGGVGSVPHAGETAGPESIRGAIDALGADRIRHGVRAVDDPELLAELAERQIVCDVCVLSNIRLGVSPSVEQHPLPTMLAAGVPCTVNTDDPTFFSCDLGSEHEAARSLGADPRTAFEAGITGALCDRDTKAHLRTILTEHDWDTPSASAASA
ncbi:MAG TPA: adenosine deaminase [Thermoleophilaceae bacterium]|nr:adenosine deaminase [Thermoleophilaceae bacterium]